MPFILLILLLFSATCTVHAAEMDSVAIALEAIPKDSLITDAGTPRVAFSVPYKYDKTKTLQVDLRKQTVKLTDKNKQILAEGQYKQPDTVSKKILPHGYWRYYHTNGKLKEEGNYIVAPYVWVDSIIVVDPVTGKEILQTKKVIRHQAMRDGTWRRYNKEGILVDEENY